MLSLLNCGHCHGHISQLADFVAIIRLHVHFVKCCVCVSCWFQGQALKGLMSHSAKVNSVIIFYLLSSGAREMVKKSCFVEIFSLWLFISCIFELQRMPMTFHSCLIPVPLLFSFFLSHRNMKSMLHFIVKKLCGLCFFSYLEIPQFVSLKWHFPLHFNKLADHF